MDLDAQRRDGTAPAPDVPSPVVPPFAAPPRTGTPAVHATAASAAELRGSRVLYVLLAVLFALAALAAAVVVLRHAARLDRAARRPWWAIAAVAALLSAGRLASAVEGMDVVAEGVETEAQLAELQAMDCRYLQGYLFGRPMPFAELRALLAGFHDSRSWTSRSRAPRKWTGVSIWWDETVDDGLPAGAQCPRASHQHARRRPHSRRPRTRLARPVADRRADPSCLRHEGFFVGRDPPHSEHAARRTSPYHAARHRRPAR